MHDIIKQLKVVRQQKKLKQSELGAKLGIPQSHISKIEQGETDPRLSTLSDMARLLDQELVLIPRAMLAMVMEIINGGDGLQPMWQPDDEEDQ